MYRSQPWPVARDTCAEEGGKLAVPKTEVTSRRSYHFHFTSFLRYPIHLFYYLLQEEFLFMQKLVRGMHYPAVTDAADKLVVWLGISNLHDHKTWTSVDGNLHFSTIIGILANYLNK